MGLMTLSSKNPPEECWLNPSAMGRADQRGLRNLRQTKRGLKGLTNTMSCWELTTAHASLLGEAWGRFPGPLVFKRGSFACGGVVHSQKKSDPGVWWCVGRASSNSIAGRSLEAFFSRDPRPSVSGTYFEDFYLPLKENWEEVGVEITFSKGIFSAFLSPPSESILPATD